MFGLTGALHSLVGSVKVEENNGIITLYGFNGRELTAQMFKVWRSNKIGNKMFTKIGKTEVSFRRFFLMDVVYVLETLMKANYVRINRRALAKAIEELKTQTSLAWVFDEETRPGPLDFSRLKDLSLVPRPHQQEYMDEYNQAVPRYGLRGHLASLGVGQGKGHVQGTKIKTPNGWKSMGEIRVGHEVLTPSGDIARVRGVYHNSKVDCYRVTFADGRSCICDIEHLWELYSYAHTDAQWRTVSMRELLALYEIQKKRNVYKSTGYLDLKIPLVNHEGTAEPDIDLPLDPYVLGVLLGDGCITRKPFTITKPDYFIRDEVVRLLKDKGVTHKDIISKTKCYAFKLIDQDRQNPWLFNTVSEMGLLGKRSWEKFIPYIYLKGSFQQRLALVQGLMDTDGSVCFNGRHFEFSTTSEVMARDVLELLRSVGCIAKITQRQTYYTYLGERKPGRISWRINIRHQKPSMLFRTPVKKDKCIDDTQYTRQGLKLRIADISYIDKLSTVCIEVDHPSKQYVIQDYICTHNTFLSLSLMHCAKVDTVIVFSPNNAVQRVWRDTLTWSHKEPVKFWDSHMQGPPPLGMSHYVIHYEYMGKFYEWLKVNYKSLGVVGIVIDECHNFNEIKSARTQLLVDIAKLTNSQHTLWMSGTPLKAMGKETIPLLRTIDPLFDTKTEKDYLDIFGQASDRALDILANRIGKISYKVDTNSVLTDIQLKKWVCNVKLPNGIDYTLDEIRKKLEAFVKERTEYYKQHEEEFKRDYLNGISYFRDCIASDEQELIRLNQYEVDVKDVRKGYDPIKHKEIVPQLNKYEKDVIMPLLPKHIKDPFKKAKSVYKYVQLTIMGEALGSVLGKARTQCNVDIANALDQVELHSSDGKLKVQTSLKEIIDNAEKKSILFTSFIEVLKASSAKLATQGFKPLEVYGETNSNLPQIVQKFAKDEDANPLIATYQSLSTAVPLTMANNLVMLNAPFREHEYRQAYGRCYRMGQDKDVTVIDVFLDTGNLPNISTRSKDIMDTTAKQVAIMLGIEKIDLTVATEAIEESIPEWLTTNRVDEVKDRVKLSSW